MIPRLDARFGLSQITEDDAKLHSKYPIPNRMPISVSEPGIRQMRLYLADSAWQMGYAEFTERCEGVYQRFIAQEISSESFVRRCYGEHLQGQTDPICFSFFKKYVLDKGIEEFSSEKASELLDLFRHIVTEGGLSQVAPNIPDAQPTALSTKIAVDKVRKESLRVERKFMQMRAREFCGNFALPKSMSKEGIIQNLEGGQIAIFNEERSFISVGGLNDNNWHPTDYNMNGEIGSLTMAPNRQVAYQVSIDDECYIIVRDIDAKSGIMVPQFEVAKTISHLAISSQGSQSVIAVCELDTNGCNALKVCYVPSLYIFVSYLKTSALSLVLSQNRCIVGLDNGFIWLFNTTERVCVGGNQLDFVPTAIKELSNKSFIAQDQTGYFFNLQWNRKKKRFFSHPVILASEDTITCFEPLLKMKLALGGHHGSVTIWDVSSTTAQLIRTLQPMGSFKDLYFKGAVQCLSASEGRVAARFKDRYIRIWNVSMRTFTEYMERIEEILTTKFLQGVHREGHNSDRML